MYQRKNEVGHTRKQILVPKLLSKKVKIVAHDSLFGGHLGVKKLESRIQTNLFLPGLHKDVTSFCQSSYVCHKTEPKSSVLPGSLGDMPLID